MEKSPKNKNHNNFEKNVIKDQKDYDNLNENYKENSINVSPISRNTKNINVHIKENESGYFENSGKSSIILANKSPEKQKNLYQSIKSKQKKFEKFKFFKI